MLVIKLAECHVLLRTYGKNADDLPVIAQNFVKHLTKYDPGQVLEAFDKHIRRSQDFPTPVDIINILEDRTNGRDKPNPSIYNEICRRLARNGTISHDDKRYKDKYENYYIES